MINKNCKKCHKPMNGGVYRKPNQCPSCGQLQNENLDARNRPIYLNKQASITDNLSINAQSPIPDETAENSITSRKEMNGGRVEPVIDDNSKQKITKISARSAPQVKEKSQLKEEKTQQKINFHAAKIKSTSTDEMSKHESRLKKAPSRSAKNVMANIRAEIDAIETRKSNSKSRQTASKSAHVNPKPNVNNLEKTNQIKLKNRSDNVAALSDHRDKSKKSVNPRLHSGVLLTTESSQNLDIRKHLDIISSDLLFPVEFRTKKGRQNVLTAARKKVLSELRKDAHTLGANAVVDVKISYNEILNGDAPKILFMATGTAVVIGDKHLKRRSQTKANNA